MKRKMIETIPPKQSKSGLNGFVVTTQIAEDTMILNIWNDGLVCRYCIRESGEYEKLVKGTWSTEKFQRILGGGYSWYFRAKDANFDSEADKTMAEEWLSARNTQSYYPHYNTWDKIDCMERDYRFRYEHDKERRRIERVDMTMQQIPPEPEDLIRWTYERIGSPDFAFWNKEKETWRLTCCGRSRKKIKAKHREEITCPICKKKITAIRRMKEIERWERVLVIDNTPIGGVMRYFQVAFNWSVTECQVRSMENVRILLGEDYRRRPVYWHQGEGFDNKRNYFHLYDYNKVTWLYGRDMEAAVEGTRWEDMTPWLLAMEGHKAVYDAWMCREHNPEILEYLAKGRFFRILEEIAPWQSILGHTGQTIEEVMKIKDRQKINRIRDRNGGTNMLSWMQWADRHRAKLSDAFLKWAEKEKVTPGSGPWLFLKLSPEQAMNYLIRQKKESYKGHATRAIISQYEDYMEMCKKLKKDLTDEMVVKPRELKRRHDEAVKELEFRQAELDAAEYSKRFPDAEKVLSEVRGNFEYKGQQYEIKVPERIIDIVTEGRYLHHCAGATDRYFDRIASHETYIVFLRKVKEPDKPYYTVEVEPGGTIRQHRGMCDEEPDIEKIKPFLREWQKEIKKRMKVIEKERAKISAIKREENIKDLKAKNNTRVLQGLLEDFMEAM